MHPNTQAREVALKYLYMKEINRGGPNFENFTSWLEVPLARSTYDFAEKLVDYVLVNKDAIDKEIQDAGSNWKVSRMAIIDRTVIRIGIAEFKAKDTACAIIIDEAIELARKYGDVDMSPKFVNGILDKLKH